MYKNNKIRNCYFYLLLIMSFSSTVRASVQTIEVYGDSLSAGFLDTTSLTAPPSLAQIGDILSDLARFAITKNIDEIHKHENRNLAWPQTVAEHFKALDPLGSVKVIDVAVTGARTSDLISELSAVPTPAADELTTAFFFIGHNDLCKNPNSVDVVAKNFARYYTTALKKWDSTHTNAEASLVPVGEINRVYSLLAGTVWYAGKKENYKCEDSWTKFFPYCPSHYEMYQKGTLDDFLGKRIQAMNAVLDGVVGTMNSKTKNGNHYRYLEKISEFAYEKNYFAVDCYHLSTLGQATLGEKVFEVLSH